MDGIDNTGMNETTQKMDVSEDSGAKDTQLEYQVDHRIQKNMSKIIPVFITTTTNSLWVWKRVQKRFQDIYNLSTDRPVQGVLN